MTNVSSTLVAESDTFLKILNLINRPPSSRSQVSHTITKDVAFNFQNCPTDSADDSCRSCMRPYQYVSGLLVGYLLHCVKFLPPVYFCSSSFARTTKPPAEIIARQTKPWTYIKFEVSRFRRCEKDWTGRDGEGRRNKTVRNAR